MDLFESVKSLNDLRLSAEDIDTLLENVKHTMSSIKEIEKLTQKVVEWLNNLFDEYNKLEHSRNKEDDILLFNVINKCTNFVPLSLKPALLTNMCILSDDESHTELHNAQFIPSLEKAINIVSFFKKLNKYAIVNEELYLDLGFLCFKAHKYEYAKEYLQASISLLKDRINSNNEDEDAIFKYGISSIYLASCIEYDASIHSSLFDRNNKRREKLSQAIQILSGCDEVSFKSNILKFSTDITRLSNVVLKGYPLSKIKQLLKKISSENNVILKIFEFEHIEELQDEYIHILSHCISEYASVIRDLQNAEFPYCSLLQMISRFFLDWLVTNRNTKYITCQATVRAENDATPEAINILLQKIEKSHNSEQTDSVAELNFYIFYFAEQELRWNYENKQLLEKFQHHRELFYNYAKSKQQKQDVDALFHHHVIYFRFLLKQCVHHIISMPNTTCDDLEQEMSNIYDELIYVSQNISHYVLEPIRSEYIRLEKLYNFYRIIRNISNLKPTLSTDSSAEFEILMNFSEQSSTQNANDALKKIYREITEPRNILLLAPIRNAPSCSFSIENVDKLKKLKLLHIADVPIDFSNFFNNTIPELDQSSIEETIQLQLLPITSKKFKWAICYRNNKLFLFYSDFKPDRELKMFPVILNAEEVNYCNKLFERLDKNQNNNRAYCGKNNGSCKNSRVHFCYAKKYIYSNQEIHDDLLNILVFVEFDFYKIDQGKGCMVSRLADDDVIIVDISKEKEYKIAAFEKYDESEDTKQICTLCSFTSSISGLSENIQKPVSQVKEDIVKEERCPEFDFQTIKRNLTTKLSSTPNGSIVSQKLNEIKELIKLCEAKNCCLPPDKPCKLDMLLNENNFSDACWR